MLLVTRNDLAIKYFKEVRLCEYGSGFSAERFDVAIGLRNDDRTARSIRSEHNLFSFGKVELECIGQHGWYPRRVVRAAVSFRLLNDAIDPIALSVEVVEARHITHQQKQHEATGDSKSEACDIDGGAAFLPEEIPKGGFEIIPEHDERVFPDSGIFNEDRAT